MRPVSTEFVYRYWTTFISEMILFYFHYINYYLVDKDTKFLIDLVRSYDRKKHDHTICYDRAAHCITQCGVFDILD